jgi:DNA-binding transcriptional MocR family regulator
MINAINTHLKDMVTFNEPTAGMFIWLKINRIEDTRQLIYEKALGQEVLLLPGSAFFVDQSKSYPYVRVSYSLCTSEQIDTVNKLILLFSINEFYLNIGYGSFW